MNLISFGDGGGCVGGDWKRPEGDGGEWENGEWEENE